MKYIKSLMLVIISVFTLSCCDDVDGNYLKSGGGDIDTSKVIKKVLLEDYTGFKCNNCPKAQRELKILLNTVYKDQLVAMAVHVGYFSKPKDGTDFWYDFRTDAGNELDAFYKASQAGLPKGIVNRKQFEDAYAQDYSKWSALVAAELEEEADLKLTLEASYDDVNKKITCDAELEYVNDQNENNQIAFYLIESGIIQPQIDGTETILEYEHNHVLRDAINGTWGEVVSESAISKGEKFNKNVAYIISADNDEETDEYYWNPANLAIIAVVYDGTTKEVLQCEEVHVDSH